MLADLAFIPTVLLVGTGAYLLINRNWRAGVVALSIQYLAAFWLVNLFWPLGLSVVKLVAGWMAGAVLSASQPPSSPDQARSAADRSRIAFRLAAAAMVAILVFSVAPQVAGGLNIALAAVQGGMVLVGLGLLQLGMTSQPLRAVLGLLTLLTGFEILYAAVESSVMMAGLQAVVTLGLALVGAYLVSATPEERS